MKGIHFTIGVIGKSSFLPLCIMAPGCYACVYETPPGTTPKWLDPMGEEFTQEVAFQNISTWLMEDVNKNNNTNLYAVTLEKQLLHWI